MLIEEKPQAFTSPEPIHEDHSNNKKKRKNKKKNAEYLVQPNEQSQPQVFSEPLVVESIQEFESNGESSILPDSNGVSMKKKKKKGDRKKKILINAQSNGEESNEMKHSLELENGKVEMVEVSGEGETVVTGKKKKRKKKRGVVDEGVVVENAHNHDRDQNESGVDGGQSNELNIISGEIAVQTVILDKEVPTKESNETKSLLELENREVEMVEVSGEGETVVIGKKKRKKKNKRGVVDEVVVGENALNHDHDQNESGVDGGQLNEKNLISAENAVQTLILDKELPTKESNETKPSIELENRKVELVEVSEEGETVVTWKKKKRKKKKKSGVVDEGVVVENALNHDQHEMNTIETEQMTDKKRRRKKEKSGLDGGQSNEQNIISAETTVQTLILDGEVPAKEPTIPLNTDAANVVEPEQKFSERNIVSAETAVQTLILDREVPAKELTIPLNTDAASVVELEQKLSERNIVSAETAVQTLILDREVPAKEPTIPLKTDAASVVELEQKLSERNIVSAETAVQTLILDREVPAKEPTIPLNTDAASVVEPEQKLSKRKKRKGKRKGELKSDGEEKTKEHNGKPLEADVQGAVELTTEPLSDPIIVTEPPPATAVEVEQKISKKKRKREKKGDSKSDGEEKPNEHNGTSLETPVLRPMEPITEPSTDPTILMDPHPATSIDAENMTAKKYKRRKKGDRKSNGEEKTNECNGKLVEASVQRAMEPITEASTNLTILLDPHPHIVTTMDAEQKIGKKNRKRKKGDSKSDGEDKPNEDNGKSPEIPVQRPLDPMTESSMDPTILPDPNPATAIDGDQSIANKHKKRRKGAHKNDGEEKSSEHNGKALETPVQRPMDHITEPSTNPAILTEPHLTTTIDVEPKIAKKHKKREKRGDNKSDVEEKPNEHNGKSLEIPVQRLMDPVTESSMEPTILPDSHPATAIDGLQNVANKHKRKRKGACKNDEEEKPSEHNDMALETPVQRTEPSTNPAILTEPHLTTTIGVEPKIAKKHKKREKKGDIKSDGEVKPNEHNGKSLEVPVQRPMDTITEPSINPTILTEPHLATTIAVEPKIAKKHKKRENKGDIKSHGEEKPNEHNGKPHETPVQKSICSITAPSKVPPLDPTILLNTQPANLRTVELIDMPLKTLVQIPMKPIPKPSTDPTDPMDPHPASPMIVEQKIAKKPEKRKREADNKSDMDEKPTEHNGKLHETLVQQSLYPITAPSTDPITAPSTDSVDPTILTDPHTASFTFPIADSTADFSVQGTEFTTEHNGKLHETLVQQSLYPVTAPSTDPVEPAILTDPHTASFTFPIADSTADFSVQGTEFTTGHNGKLHETLIQQSLYPITAPSTDPVDPAILTDPHPASFTFPIADSTAEFSVQGTEFTFAPNDQLEIGAMICWACRQPDHTIQQCRKLKYLSMNEEVCFFCGEIGHSLGRCSVHIAGGGRLARCLFCDAYGHFGYNCPGDGHDPKELWPWKLKGKFGVKVANV